MLDALSFPQENPMRKPGIRRAVSLLAFLFALAPALAAAPARPAARNMLGNPGFERQLGGHDWMPAGWDTSDAGLPTVFFGRDSFLVHGGKFSVNIANTSTLYSMGHNWSQTLLVGRETWGKTAVFSAWTLSNGVQGRAYLLLQAYRDTVSKMSRIWGVDREDARKRMGINKIDDPLIDLGWKRLQFEDPQTEWVRREVRVVVPVGVNVLFCRCGLLGTGQLIVDDASLTLEPTPPAPQYAAGTNLFADPGFEQGGDAWEIAVPPFEGARIDRDSTVAHSGRLSMRCSNMNDGLTSARMGVCQAISARGLAGKRLRLTGWFRGDSLVSRAYVSLYFHSRRGMIPAGTTEQLSGTFDWTRPSVEMDVPPGTDELWAWLMFDAPCRGRLWIDDGVLEVLGPATGVPARSAPPAAEKPR